MHEIEFTVFLKDLETSQFFNKNKSLFTKSKPGFVVMLGVFSLIHHIHFTFLRRKDLSYPNQSTIVLYFLKSRSLFKRDRMSTNPVHE